MVVSPAAQPQACRYPRADQPYFSRATRATTSVSTISATADATSDDQGDQKPRAAPQNSHGRST